jgi:hypothetical protein
MGKEERADRVDKAETADREGTGAEQDASFVPPPRIRWEYDCAPRAGAADQGRRDARNYAGTDRPVGLARFFRASQFLRN